MTRQEAISAAAKALEDYTESAMAAAEAVISAIYDDVFNAGYADGENEAEMNQ